MKWRQKSKREKRTDAREAKKKKMNILATQKTKGKCRCARKTAGRARKMPLRKKIAGEPGHNILPQENGKDKQIFLIIICSVSGMSGWPLLWHVLWECEHTASHPHWLDMESEQH